MNDTFSPERFAWSQQFHDGVKSYLGKRFFKEATFEEDCKEATDLKVYHINTDITIAVRLRGFEKYAERYWHDVTLRSYSNGHETEIHKIQQGWGDYFFYGFGCNDQRTIKLFSFLNLQAWRDNWDLIQPREEHPNYDNHTAFDAFDLRELDRYQLPRIIEDCAKDLRQKLDEAKMLKKPATRADELIKRALSEG